MSTQDSSERQSASSMAPNGCSLSLQLLTVLNPRRSRAVNASRSQSRDHSGYRYKRPDARSAMIGSQTPPIHYVIHWGLCASDGNDTWPDLLRHHGLYSVIVTRHACSIYTWPVRRLTITTSLLSPTTSTSNTSPQTIPSGKV